jgi:hypothetical protein
MAQNCLGISTGFHEASIAFREWPALAFFSPVNSAAVSRRADEFFRKLLKRLNNYFPVVFSSAVTYYKSTTLTLQFFVAFFRAQFVY